LSPPPNAQFSSHHQPKTTAAVSNDIFTHKDQELLIPRRALPASRTPRSRPADACMRPSARTSPPTSARLNNFRPISTANCCGGEQGDNLAANYSSDHSSTRFPSCPLSLALTHSRTDGPRAPRERLPGHNGPRCEDHVGGWVNDVCEGQGGEGAVLLHPHVNLAYAHSHSLLTCF
jgi:hypothetical protein